MEWLAALNLEQRQAVEAGDGPVLIIAGPGTGKTKTLAARIAYLVAAGKAKPEEILALTFTAKSAEEMRNRVHDMAVNGQAASVSDQGIPHITTFHAFCHGLLDSKLPFINDAKRLSIIKALGKPAELRGVGTRELGLRISRAKNMADDNPAVVRLVQSYDKALQAAGVIDFDDLLVRVYDLLRSDDQKRASVQSQFRYVLVDEFQDTNRLQYELLQLVRANANLFVIGDPYQSIYGFRGASGDIFGQFMHDHPDTQKITLHVNYRSAPEIVRLSNAIFRNGNVLRAQAPTGGQVQVVEVLNEYSEAAWIAGEIQRAIGGGDLLRVASDDERTTHHTLKDFAILYRSRLAALAVQKGIAESGLPYQIVGDGSPYDKPSLQTILNTLRLSLNDRVIELGELTLPEQKLITEYAAKHAATPPHNFAQTLITMLGFEPSCELDQLLGSLARFDSIRAAVAYFDQLAEQQFYDPQADAMTLLTIHAAKGLEFPYVFLVAAEEGVLPSSRSDLTEEKRLFYVAATRAKERLEITYARHRSGKSAEASRFIANLPANLVRRLTDPDMQAQARRIAKKAAKRSQQSLF
ncbi:MAG TPA: ATP-dependent helicase [Candidatus Saccharimonadales bacterium]|nr:ATP-dependent helicase [Candidatus Saccharimonadales bacterium]